MLPGEPEALKASKFLPFVWPLNRKSSYQTDTSLTQHCSEIPIGRLGTPEEIAETVLWMYVYRVSQFTVLHAFKGRESNLLKTLLFYLIGATTRLSPRHGNR